MQSLRLWVLRTPVLRQVATIVVTFLQRFRFRDSTKYWEERYSKGGTSGSGSHGELARMKAKILNDFVREEGIPSLVELGCGDGRQLELAAYPDYIGLDVSETAIARCQQVFSGDSTKRFFVMSHDVRIEKDSDFLAACALSIDVIYHLVEDAVFEAYMLNLFALAQQHVVIYSSDTNANDRFQSPHVRHRRFSDWIGENRPEWEKVRTIRNPFAGTQDVEKISPSDFHFYRKR